MITRSQMRAVSSSALPTLDAMWEQRRRWWFAHFSGDLDAEARAAAKAAKLHADLITKTHMPELLVKQWEREWDDWFESKLSRFMTRRER